MTSRRLIPVLLLRGNGSGIVKTTKFKNPTYLGDCLNAVKIFNEKEVDELVILDINCSNECREPDYKLINEIASECFMPLAYGGGIKDIDQIKQVFSQGVEKIIINSASTNYSLIENASKIYGSQSIIISLDVKKNIFGDYDLYFNSGSIKSKISLNNHIKNLNNAGAGEIIIQSINKDGTLSGYDLKLINRVSHLTDLPLIALGGASSLDDFNDAINNGASGVAAGSFFVFFGKHKAVLISYPNQDELIKIFK